MSHLFYPTPANPAPCLEAGDPFEAMYAPWPFRFYILQREADGVVRVAMKAQPYEASYNISDVRNFLLDQRR